MFTRSSSPQLLRLGVLALGFAMLVAACGGGSTEITAVNDGVAVPVEPTTVPQVETPADSADVTDEPTKPRSAQDENSTTSSDASEAAGLVADAVAELGGGTITLDGIEYVFATEFCADDEDGMFNQGNGIAPDGTPFTARIFVQPFLEDSLVTAELTLGKETIYGPPILDQPYFETNSLRDAAMTFTIEGTRVFGSGPAVDYHEIALADGETATLTFDGQCGDSVTPGIDSDQQEVGSNYCALAQVEVDTAAAFAVDVDITTTDFENYLSTALDIASEIDRPAAIAAELDIVHTALAAADEAARANGYNFMASFGDMAATLGSQESISAGLVIEDYNQRVCGIDGLN